MQKTRTSVFVPVAVLLMIATAGLLVGGCGGDGGPKRYAVSGSVTLDGSPVPAGEIVFEPDGSQGNSGPQGYARITAGKYKTEPDRGVVGGPHQVRIRGYNAAPQGEETVELLFDNYLVNEDLPRSAAVKDFDVPRSASER